jgi:hypothetical protein
MPTCRRLVLSAPIFALAAALLLGRLDRAAAGEAERGPRRARAEARLPVGSDAPDFNLPRLVIEKHDDGRWTGRVGPEAEAVRLSAHRGKRPVCLFLSSYT